MLFVLIGAALVIVVWSTWLVRARPVPRWVRSVAPAVVVATIVSGCVTMWQMHRAFDAVDGESAQKASRLAAAISTAMGTLAAGLVVVGVGALILAYFTLRRR